jgi:hypothetical protein
MKKKQVSIELVVRDSWHWFVELSYDTYQNCELYGCDSICRCGKIENIEITSVNLRGIAQEMVKKLGWTKNPIKAYCLERLLIAAKLYRLIVCDVWDVRVENNYYGEEIWGVNIDCGIAASLIEQLEAIQKMTNDRAIAFVLEKEYGYVLEKLQGAKYELFSTPVKDLVFGQDSHYKKLDEYTIEYYAEHEWEGVPQGIILRDGKVIDGYHRLSAAKRSKHRNVKVLSVI